MLSRTHTHHITGCPHSPGNPPAWFKSMRQPMVFQSIQWDLVLLQWGRMQWCQEKAPGPGLHQSWQGLQASGLSLEWIAYCVDTAWQPQQRFHGSRVGIILEDDKQQLHSFFLCMETHQRSHSECKEKNKEQEKYYEREKTTPGIMIYRVWKISCKFLKTSGTYFLGCL